MYTDVVKDEIEYIPKFREENIQVLILGVLETQSLHGYGIAKEIERRSGEALSFGEGTVYPALKGLEREEFVKSEWILPAIGPARKIYSLTENGQNELSKRHRTWFRFFDSINSVLKGGHPSEAI